MRRFISVILSVSSIIAFLVLAANTVGYNALPYAYGQTNAGALAALSANNTDATTTAEGLQIKTVNYFDDASGYLVYPSAGNTTSSIKLPAIVMIHENRGLNDNIKNMANTFAKQGYVVLAVDLFKGHVATTNDQARQLASSVRNNTSAAIANLQSAAKYVSSLDNVNASRIASLGWCFGGGQSLQLALHSEQHPLAATILYYGTPLITDKQELSKIKWPVLGIFGDKDQAIPVEKVKEFESALNAQGIPNEIHIYKGVGHAFANPSGANYAPKETADAWQKTLAFLKKYV
jgi:carboxymethylenebutenolidase